MSGQNSSISISDVQLSRQKDLSKFGVPGANYSGITALGSNNYAVVSDKEKMDGYYKFFINIDTFTGKILDVTRNSLLGVQPQSVNKEGISLRDCEGIAYVSPRNSIFISGEGDQRIVEHSLDGQATGKELSVPRSLNNTSIYINYGFEALAYSSADNLIWTVTEHTLKDDGPKSDYKNPVGCKLRFQSFGLDLLPKDQYIYITDAPIAKKAPKTYAFGVPAICALEDGSLLVLEREAFVAKRYLGSFVRCKLFHVQIPASPNQTMQKVLIADFTTRLNVMARSFANYEGMCLGPRLSDGTQTLLLISDSQNNFGNSLFHIKDYIKVLKLRYN